MELVVAFAVEGVPLAPTFDVRAFDGALSTAEEGVYCAAVVMAFDPADEDPDEAKDEEAPGPELPEELLLWI
jgi:hypothetical protein